MLAVPVVTNPGSNTVRVSSTTKSSLAAIDGMRMYMLYTSSGSRLSESQP